MKKIKSAGLKNRALKRMTTLIIFAMIVMVMLFYGIVYSRIIRNQGKNQEKSLANLDAYLNSYFEEVDSIAKNGNSDRPGGQLYRSICQKKYAGI